MELQFTQMENNIRVIKLIGKLDIMGANEIEPKFSGYCSGQKPRVLVDLSGVDFLTSIGIRLLVINAKAVANRGGKMALLNPNPDVKNMLEVSDIPSIIPLYSNLESAETVVLAS